MNRINRRIFPISHLRGLVSQSASTWSVGMVVCEKSYRRLLVSTWIGSMGRKGRKALAPTTLYHLPGAERVAPDFVAVRRPVIAHHLQGALGAVELEPRRAVFLHREAGSHRREHAAAEIERDLRVVGHLCPDDAAAHLARLFNAPLGGLDLDSAARARDHRGVSAKGVERLHGAERAVNVALFRIVFGKHHRRADF